MFKRYKLTDIPNIKNRAVFFDANVIIYLFWATYSNDYNSNRYASIFKKLLENKNSLLINLSVLSEVINRVLRIEWEKITGKCINFKQFRKSDNGLQVQEDIFNIIKNKILKTFHLTDEKIMLDDIKKLLITDDLDFTDKIIFHVCKTGNIVLLTHDADFSNADIDILSANEKILIPTK